MRGNRIAPQGTRLAKVFAICAIGIEVVATIAWVLILGWFLFWAADTPLNLWSAGSFEHEPRKKCMHKWSRRRFSSRCARRLVEDRSRVCFDGPLALVIDGRLNRAVSRYWPIATTWNLGWSLAEQSLPV